MDPELIPNPNDSQKSPDFVRKNLNHVDWLGAAPFLGLHFACLLVFITGWSPVALGVGLATYVTRGFCITGGYHRYFSHHSYKTGRVFQFLVALVGTMAVQYGPLWWVSHHRNHHRYSDKEKDIHSPVTQSFWWSHIGWILDSASYRRVDMELVGDLAKYPELRWLDRWCLLPPIFLAVALLGLGHWLAIVHPELGTSGLQMLAWAFFVSTVALYHATFSVNSFAHVFGQQRFDTKDQSRNNTWVAFFALGEGWHNNHHRFPFSERQGIYWWEIDMTHAILTVLSRLGVVHSLRSASVQMAEEALRKDKS